MEENKNITVETPAAEEDAYLVKLGKPYLFEGKEYTEIDLSDLEKLTVQDAIDAQKQVLRDGETAAAWMCETTTAFAMALAVKATGLPVELFKMMPRGAFKKVTAVVQSCLSWAEKTKNHVMRLEKPCQYKGKKYREIDLNGVADLNTMHESEAENRLVREDFVVAGNNATYYLYACVIASMATGLPEEFFTSLPLCETVKLKNAVNDGDFFE